MGDIVIIIPARFASTRYPGKPLAELRDATGEAKSLIHRSWEAAQRVSGVAAIYIATDDDRIARHARGFGGEVLMTSPDCANGTERCAEAVGLLPSEPEIVINLQGDAPLTPHWFVEGLIASLRERPDADLATPVLRCDRTTYDAFIQDRRAGRVGGTTAILRNDGEALYFSKEVIPYIDPLKLDGLTELPVFHHVGVYAYRPSILRQYPDWPVGPLELQEGLEQLRFLENGHKVICVEVESRGQIFWELNNPEDIEKIEKALKLA